MARIPKAVIFGGIFLLIILFLISQQNGSRKSRQGEEINVHINRSHSVAPLNIDIPQRVTSSPGSPTNKVYLITILIVLTGSSTADEYKEAISSVRCYSKIQGYQFEMVKESDFPQCRQQNKFFRRHCIAAHYLPKAEYLLFLDADIGVVNPKRRIEEYIDDSNIIFYDRMFNHEIMTGSYIAKNSTWTKDFLLEFANMDTQLQGYFHGHDNGIIHEFLAKKLFPERIRDMEKCDKAYRKSKKWQDLFAVEACYRAVMGLFRTERGVTIIRKGKAWARDSFHANSKWSAERDFMFHGMKTVRIKRYQQNDLPLTMEPRGDNQWFNYLTRPLQDSDCIPGKFDWPYDKNLIANGTELTKWLDERESNGEIERYRSLGYLEKLL